MTLSHPFEKQMNMSISSSFGFALEQLFTIGLLFHTFIFSLVEDVRSPMESLFNELPYIYLYDMNFEQDYEVVVTKKHFLGKV